MAISDFFGQQISLRVTSELYPLSFRHVSPSSAAITSATSGVVQSGEDTYVSVHNRQVHRVERVFSSIDGFGTRDATLSMPCEQAFALRSEVVFCLSLAAALVVVGVVMDFKR